MASGMDRSLPAFPLQDAQVSIVGLGLMGGSLAAALKRAHACRRVVGAVRRRETASLAMQRGWVDAAWTGLAEALAEADVVVMATPVRTIMELLPTVGQLVRPGCLVMDLGSTKSKIARALSLLPEGVEALGGHPMCGKESSGLDAADPALFEGQVFVLAPLRRTGKGALALARQLVTAIGARPLELRAEEHDCLVAAISHLPYLLACGLVRTADQVASAQPVLWQLASSGFRDTSRLAASNVDMMLDILATNRDAVLTLLRDFQIELHRLEHLLEAADENTLRSELDSAAQRRRGLYA